MNPHQKTAANIAKQIMGKLRPKTGQTEKEIVFCIENALAVAGAKPSFKTIVGSGLNSFDPHAIPGNKKLQPGDQVVVDFGAQYKGYCSDMTRTFFVGQPSLKQKQIYALLKQAQQRAIKAVKAGVTCREIDLVARQYIQNHCALYCHLTNKQCSGDCFVHTTGHGIGRQVHQEPKISLRNHYRLKAGQVITIEPGIYIKGWGGMRIEDMVLVTNKGCEVLTR